MTQISLRGWGWRHHGRAAWALRGVDLDVAAGERALLLGASGAGKSTLLAAVAGLLDPGPDGNGEQEGEVLLDGVPAPQVRREAVLSNAFEGGRGRARTGLLLQDPSSQTVLARCGDDVAFGLENHAVPRPQIWSRVRQALADVRLDVPLEHPTAHLSGGQRQRLALAGVLALEPDVLLLDEPTSMLDREATTGLASLVKDLLDRTGSGALVVEHRVATWLDVVERVVVLEAGGGVVADGSPHDVLDRQGAALAASGVWVPGRHPQVSRGARSRSARDELLQAKGLQVSRRGRSAPVLDGVDLDVRAGTATALTGPNGAGKSTLSLVLAGLAKPSGGELVAGPKLREGLDATAPWVWRPRDLVVRIGSVFQDPRHQFVAATVAEELAVGPHRAGASEHETAARVDELLERLRLTHLAHANPFTLSGGEQRRLSVATAIATRPTLVVLDEPTFGQDAVTWAELAALLDELVAQGAAVVAATHDEALVETVADSVLALDGGTAIARVVA